MMMPIQVGDVLLGKYRVEGILGRGGMGVVLSARHVELGELFAIKLLLPDAIGHAEALERFLREARAAARLRSEHVARVVDVGRLENGAPYMIMEHLTGSDLAAFIQARGTLPLDEAIEYVTQACEALSEAHRVGIIHRDIKPSNLFLTRRANGGACVKVLDFGISKHRGVDEVDLTRTDVVLGSPQYMSPEQMRRTKSVDARSDVWSMGVVLYKLVTGIVPFRGDTITEVISSVLQDEPQPPSMIRPDLPPPLDVFMARALQKKPDQRFQSISDFTEALTSLRTGAAGASATAVAAATSVRRSEPALPTLDGTTVEAARTLRGRALGRPTILVMVIALIASAALASGWILYRIGAQAPDAKMAASASAASSPAVGPAPTSTAGGTTRAQEVLVAPSQSSAAVEPAPGASSAASSTSNAGRGAAPTSSSTSKQAVTAAPSSARAPASGAGSSAAKSAETSSSKTSDTPPAPTKGRSIY